VSNRLHAAAARFAALPELFLLILLFAAVALGHATLLHLPYFWDEGGYYIPAALDFYHTGQLVPHFTNAHPPLPNVLLGTLWHVVGYHIVATRLFVCAVAAAGLLAIFRLTQRLLDPTAAFCVTLLTAVYPIWFAQSSLAHADIFAAAFTLWAFALYLPLSASSTERNVPDHATTTRLFCIAALFTLSVLSKETSIVQPATFSALEIFYLVRSRKSQTIRREHLHRLASVAFPVIPLILWYAYHHHITGFTFGNPEYLRYNATANLTAGHISQAFRYRFLHLFWQRNIWLPILLAIASLFLPQRSHSVILSEVSQSHHDAQSKHKSGDTHSDSDLGEPPNLVPAALRTILLLILTNWLFFSVLGGALLTRYLLPIYPLILILCFVTWRAHTSWWPVFTAVTAAAFLSGLWINPPTSFAPEDTLTYRDMIVVDQEAIGYVAQHYPDATVLTAWPVAADLFRPELGYVTRPIHAHSIEDFTRAQIERAAADPSAYDTAIVFTTHFTTPSFRHWLLAHPNSARGREFAATRDLTPSEIATILGGRIVWQDDRNGEWAAVLRFNRSYNALLRPPVLLRPPTLVCPAVLQLATLAGSSISARCNS
jgi:4-amino-4-deoxy-L-arabinose transferase-like glycosyltransferase